MSPLLEGNIKSLQNSSLSDLNKGSGLVLGYTVLYSENSAVKGVLYIEDENKRRKLITTSDKLITNN